MSTAGSHFVPPFRLSSRPLVGPWLPEPGIGASPPLPGIHDMQVWCEASMNSMAWKYACIGYTVLMMDVTEVTGRSVLTYLARSFWRRLMSSRVSQRGRVCVNEGSTSKVAKLESSITIEHSSQHSRQSAALLCRSQSRRWVSPCKMVYVYANDRVNLAHEGRVVVPCRTPNGPPEITPPDVAATRRQL